MAGHSHWAGIKHKKGKADKQKSNLFSKSSYPLPFPTSQFIPIAHTYNSNSEKCIYGVFGERGEGIDVHFDTLKEAIFYANNYSDHEGVYPKEKGSSWTIHVGPMMKTENKSPKPEKTEKEEASTLNSRERLLEKELSRLLLKKLPNREKLVKSSGTAYQFMIPAKKTKVDKEKK